MASKVTCTCGWSWNKSDSSKKDMYVCHQCGKDNTMKNGGWLDKFQEGREKKPITTREDFEPGILSNIPGLTSIASGNQPGYNRQERYGPLGDLYRYYGGQPLKYKVLVESQNKPSTSKDKNAKYISLNHDQEFVNEVLDNYKRVSSGKLDKGIESKLSDNSWSVSGYSSAGKNAHKTKKQGSEHHSNAIGRYTLGKGKDEKGEYISYYDKFDQGTGTGINPGELLGLTKSFEIYDRIYLDPKTGKPKMKNGGWLSKYNTPEAQNGIEGTMAGLTDKGFNYNGAWGGTMAMGGSLPGSVGFTYARTQDPAPSNGKYAKKTKASAQNGQEMKFYQEGLDWKPKTISRDGSIIEDDMGQWAHPGEITKINSNKITMQDVNYPVLGISDIGDMQMMYPDQDYTYKGEAVTEIPMMQNGDKVKRFLNEAKNSIIKGGGNPVSTVVNLVEPSVDLLASTLAPHETIKEREALFNKYRPVEYPNPINITRGLLYPEEQGSPRRDMEGNYDIGEEAWRKALDLPVKENYIIPSQYKPTDAKNPKSKYYTLNNIIDSDKIITEAKKLGWKPGASYNVRSLAPFIKKGAVIDEEDFGNVDPLQQFQLDIDPEGKYASIYDKYDFKYSSLNKIIKPYEFYDRFYLPEKKISKGKKENGGWLSKYN